MSLWVAVDNPSSLVATHLLSFIRIIRAVKTVRTVWQKDHVAPLLRTPSITCKYGLNTSISQRRTQPHGSSKIPNRGIVDRPTGRLDTLFESVGTSKLRPTTRRLDDSRIASVRMLCCLVLISQWQSLSMCWSLQSHAIPCWLYRCLECLDGYSF